MKLKPKKRNYEYIICMIICMIKQYQYEENQSGDFHDSVFSKFLHTSNNWLTIQSGEIPFEFSTWNFAFNLDEILAT